MIRDALAMHPGVRELYALASAGHGDRVAIVDANFPAASTARRLVSIPGADAGAVLRAVLSGVPIDTYVPDPALVLAGTVLAGVPGQAFAQDAAAQLAVMGRYGGAGIVPSGAYHLESPTTVTERRMEAWELLFPAPPEPA